MAIKFRFLLENLQNLFVRSDKAFYNHKTELLGQKGPTLIPFDKPGDLFKTETELHQVISKRGDLFSNGRFRKVLRDNPDTDAPEDSELMKLLAQPNILQSQNKWLKNYLEQLDTYGNQFIFGNRTTRLMKYPESLKNLSARYLTPILTGKWFNQIDMEGIVAKYEYRDAMMSMDFETKDILWTKVDDLDNPIVGVSPLISLQYPITNTRYAYQYFNVISGEKGMIGMISGDSKDGHGALPMGDEDRAELERAYVERYGIKDGQRRVAIVGSAMKWTPMSYPTKDLLLPEQISMNKLTIGDHYGLNGNIWSAKGQTFENVKNGLIATYTDSIIPAADAFTQSLTQFLIDDPRFKIILDYKHIGILQAEKGNEADILSAQLANLREAVEMNIISETERTEIARNSFGLD